MLTSLTKALRFRAALALAALYAFCVLAPHAALALGGALGHCLNEVSAAHVHQPPAVTHVHADGTVHTHAKPAGHGDRDTAKHNDSAKHEPRGSDHRSPANCCGVFCLSAMAQDNFVKLAPDHVGTVLIADVPETLSGRAPGRINRPPIV
jgi:hypothetical protein